MNPAELEKFLRAKKPRDHEVHNWHLRHDQPPCWCGLCHCEKCAALRAALARTGHATVKPQ